MHQLIVTIKEWVSTHYGWLISDDKIEWHVSRIIKAQGLTEEDFLQRLRLNHPLIVNAIIEALTVQESYFFRDASLFLYLKKTLLPLLIKKKQQQADYQLNIWSAGAAFGEEIYSIAIYLEQLLPNIKHWQLHLLATDINHCALERGRKGLFSQASLRATDPQVINEYFDPHSGPYPYLLKARIREMVKWKYQNIANLRHMQKEEFDIILCRNVFIYLNRNTIESALHCFYQSLVEGGTLFLGSSDLIRGIPHSFLIEHSGDLALLKKQHSPEVSEPIPIPRKAPSFIQPYTQEKTLALIPELLKKGSYQEALEKIENSLSFMKTALLYRYKGEALMNLGDSVNALPALTESLKLNPLDAVCYFFLGLVELDMKQTITAIHSLQKALYLQNNFPEAAYHLSLLYIQNNQWQKGMRLLERSLAYAKTQAPEKPVLGADGTMAQFIEAIYGSTPFKGAL